MIPNQTCMRQEKIHKEKNILKITESSEREILIFYRISDKNQEQHYCFKSLLGSHSENVRPVGSNKTCFVFPCFLEQMSHIHRQNRDNKERKGTTIKNLNIHENARSSSV